MTKDAGLDNHSRWLPALRLMIDSIDLLLLPIRLNDLDRLAEPQRVNDLPFAKKLQAVLDIDVVRHVDQPLVRGPRLLFSSDILVQIRDRIALGLDMSRRGTPPAFS